VVPDYRGIGDLQYLRGRLPVLRREEHQRSDAVARFFEIAKPILDGDVTLITAEEISAK